MGDYEPIAGWTPPDPSLAQKRIATSPSGREVWVTITSADRLAVIDSFPHRWPEVIKARERGERVEDIAKTVRLPFEQFVEELGAAYSILETILHDVAQRRARLMV